MADVRMTIQEYDSLKKELDDYKRIIDALTTPVIDKWAIDYCKEHKTGNINVQGFLNDQFLSNKLRKIIIDNLGKLGELNEDKLEGLDIEIEKTFTFNIGSLHSIEIENPEVNE